MKKQIRVNESFVIFILTAIPVVLALYGWANLWPFWLVFLLFLVALFFAILNRAMHEHKLEQEKEKQRNKVIKRQIILNRKK